ncbi:MAG: hypothetical protein US94_C0015G0003 [Berkelbacteria bacterium GW2011_GWB1_38_5]|uniref:Polysaccharide chain length determinant N-terminal domain-containing protein n=1 Tax=Berkelbacteria bacterium GW2011_GWB1_38_5 TaxID=1618336 RepID=A0A0G0KEW4_9BACT|nr:MAG: hypothetical protein US94_C0015G0003 [Berkelbacteria bacterium GW2011_GWB1_38_5]
MELREYFRIIGRYKIIFWGVVILALAGTILFTKLQPKSYLASTTITVNKASSLKQSQVNYYLFDNYYNVQSSGLFSQIITSWFSSPALVKEIYSKADISLPPVSQKKLAKIFKAVRQEPATINISVTNSNKEEAEKLITAAASVMQDKSNELGRSDRENVYDIVTFSSIVSDASANLWLNIFIGLISGILVGIVLTLGVDYFKRD